ncbi:tetratricopeptide repeat protein [Acetivibrio clariflavus]|uniref:Tetratricopeptide repeat-containing protein n=1 Tax=Acetivibrio clariflavus (strain DSM 19732 / NBRC 101661 / EBR45) TaxID=720554 RepID=G8M1F7_ACECE|nr:tetratricopeptide repeat protein [Acetivibrio clariflavus]AEV69172.1 hypothetical protein Clocl_2604 [Acetivibrio clariflavus DSM 19732]
MTDFKQEIKTYSPIDLDRLLKTNIDMPDNLKNSVLLYNKALDNIRIKSEDIAIIELKKAISLNPDFCEAINLLGLLYTTINENNLARNCFEKVLSIDPQDRKASEYLRLLDNDYKRPGNNIKVKHKEKSENKKSNVKNVKNKKKDNKKDSIFTELSYSISNILKMNAAKYLIGFLAGLLVFFAISTIAGSKESAKDVSNVIDNRRKNQSSIDYEEKYNQLAEENNALQKQLEDLQNQLEGLQKTAQNYTNLSQLLLIEKKVSGGDYVGAADMLVAFNAEGLNETEKEKYESLRKQAMEKAAQQMYNEGRDLYKKKQYGEALEKFNKVVAYVDEWKNSSATIYYIGVCHQELNDKDKALEAFNKVIERYPSSSFAKYAKSRVDSINSGT